MAMLNNHRVGIAVVFFICIFIIFIIRLCMMITSHRRYVEPNFGQRFHGAHGIYKTLSLLHDLTMFMG